MNNLKHFEDVVTNQAPKDKQFWDTVNIKALFNGRISN
jgi:hypothetical protein